MNILKIKNIYAVMGLIFSLMFTFSCKEDDHYDPNTSVISDKTLMELINENSNLSKFGELLKKVKYDEIVNSDESFTVWVPDNKYMEGINLTDDKEILRFVKNHIARFIHNASGSKNETVYMLNTKLIKFTGNTNAYEFGNVKLEQPNIVARNGVMHIIEGRVDFTPNLWEKMEAPQFDSIRNYLYPQTSMEFDQDASSIIDYNEEGMAVYDSVFVEKNSFWEPYSMGMGIQAREFPLLFFRGGFSTINDEDSTFTMLIPTNKAWLEAYDRVSQYFVSNALQNPDSIQRYYTCFAMVQDLVFRGNVSPEANNTIESTRLAIFPEPSYLVEGSQREKVSNGWAYALDQFRIKPEESWFKPIKVEAEHSYTRVAPPTNIGDVQIRVTENSSVSGNLYLYVTATGGGSPIDTTYVEFLLPNTLSATYNIYCMFAPDKESNPVPKKTKIIYKMYQMDRETKEWKGIRSGGVFDEAFIRPTGTEGDIHATEFTKFLLYENFEFPYAYINEDQIPIKIRIQTNVKLPPELGSYVNRMSIDYLILEPVHN